MFLIFVCWCPDSPKIIIVIVVSSLVRSLTDKGDHTALYKINISINTKTSEIVII